MNIDYKFDKLTINYYYFSVDCFEFSIYIIISPALKDNLSSSFSLLMSCIFPFLAFLYGCDGGCPYCILYLKEKTFNILRLSMIE